MSNPLLLLHGFAGGTWSWEQVTAALTPRKSALLVPTLTYHESSDGELLPEVDFAGEVERLANLVVHSGAKPIDLVGYSMGGRLALGLAIAHPELVRSLVLVSARRGLDCAMEQACRRQVDANWAELLEREGLDAFLDRWWTQPIFRSLSQLAPERLAPELAHRRSHRAAQLAAALRKWGLGCQPAYSAEVRRLRTPVILVAGKLDEKFVGLSLDLAAELPRGRCIMVEGAGHQLLLEAPGELARIIDEEIES